MVYVGGHLSRAHYNLAVSFGVFLCRKLNAADMVA
jgi:glycerol uptake facilitator-like aquaporin